MQNQYEEIAADIGGQAKLKKLKKAIVDLKVSLTENDKSDL